jgi:hypothetical protein
MKDHLKLALKLIVTYGVMVLISVVFVLPFYTHMYAYSIVMFIIMFLFITSDMSEQARKEKRTYNNLNPYLLKGFVIGLITCIPFLILIIVVPFINVETKALNVGALKQLILNTLMIPMYFIIKLGNKTTIAYLIALSMIPLLSGIGYISGYLGFSLMDFLYEKFGFRLPGPKKKKK